MTDFWPHAALRPSDTTCQYLARTTAGTVSTSGFTQRVASPANAWAISYGRVVLKDMPEIRTWRAVEAGLDGGAVAIYVPLVGLEQGTINGTLVGAHAAGVTSAVIRRVGAAITGGYHFAVGDGRLHLVVSVSGVSTDDYTCVIRPPLRAAYPDTTAVEFERPVCKCRLASDDAMQLTVTPGGMAIGRVRFVEDPNS